MPHRVLFQWGKNHAHPFTMFVGGFVIGTLVTAAVAYGWYVANDTATAGDSENVVNVGTPKPKASASPVATPSASPTSALF